MKLLRYGEPGAENPGLLDEEGQIRDLSAEVGDIDAEWLGHAGIAALGSVDLDSLPVVDGKPRIGACVGGVGKFICVGLNYADHAKESGMDVPTEPVLFMKATSAITGPNDDVLLPRNYSKADWEVELGIVIGKEARYVSPADALDYVAGLCLINDLSERAFQLESGGQWVKGKSCDTFGPIGPWLVTLDEIDDFRNLDMHLDVNGHRMQTGNTRTMIFDVPELVSYISQYMSLQPGDVISTGTPPGVGLGMDPQVWLQEGDVMELGIQELGVQRQRTVAEG